MLSICSSAFVCSIQNGLLGTTTNNSGGIQGGISNGENIYFRVAFKPPATIGQEQSTATFGGQETVLAAKGRHDPCVVPRAVPIVEAMAALVLADAAMAQLARQAAAAPLEAPLVLHGGGDGDEAAADAGGAALAVLQHQVADLSRRLEV